VNAIGVAFPKMTVWSATRKFQTSKKRSGRHRMGAECRKRDAQRVAFPPFQTTELFDTIGALRMYRPIGGSWLSSDQDHNAILIIREFAVFF